MRCGLHLGEQTCQLLVRKARLSHSFGTLNSHGIVRPSGLNLLKCGIQAFQLHAGVSAGEVPVGLGVVGVAARAPRVHLGSE